MIQQAKRVTANDNERQRVTKNGNQGLFRLIFLFFWIREEPITKAPKEDPFNQRLWGGPVELKEDLGKQAPKKKY